MLEEQADELGEGEDVGQIEVQLDLVGGEVLGDLWHHESAHGPTLRAGPETPMDAGRPAAAGTTRCALVAGEGGAGQGDPRSSLRTGGRHRGPSVRAYTAASPPDGVPVLAGC